MQVLLVNNIFSRSFVEFSGVSKAMLVFFLFPIFLTADYRAPPIVSNTTYVLAWNGPSEQCMQRYDIFLDMSIYSLIGNPKFGVSRQNVTIFYIEKLGMYPFIDFQTKQQKYGVIPQSADLNAHLKKAESDIIYYLPKDELGLAVIDYEEWRPIWKRNWGDRIFYRRKSIELVKQTSPGLSDEAAESLAQRQFEAAAKEFMLKTLQLGVKLRPNNYWGFHNFPDCYNHNYHNNENYTGSCPEIDKQRNNELSWLWNESTALYPTIYLNTKLKQTPQAALFSRNRVNEAIRIAKSWDRNNPLPVFVYTRSVFVDNSSEFLSEIDLVNTIGETYALGASGIVIWGSYTIAQNKVACQKLQTFERQTLNPYLINVTLAAKMCHQALCQDRGFCTRKNWNSNDYLHLNPRNFLIKFAYCDKFTIYGEPSVEDLRQFSDKFDCTCFTNVTCKKNAKVENIKNIRVCITEEVCISAFVNSRENRKGVRTRNSKATITNPTISRTKTTTTSTKTPITTTRTSTTTTTTTTTTTKRPRIF